MSLHSAGQVVQSVKLFPGNSITDNCKKDFIFFDFVGLCDSNKSKKSGIRRRLSNVRRNQFLGLAASKKNWVVPSITSVLELERVDSGSQQQYPDPKPKVANLEDIISERGACGVGFIANLDNKASHDIVKDALTALGCMEHRGGCGADNDSGDGSGVMTSIPWELFNNWSNEQGMSAFDQMHTGVGMVFLPKDDDLMKQAQTGQSIIYFFRSPNADAIYNLLVLD